MAAHDAALDRARKLLSLAVGTPDEEEARTAALQAARLIAREGLEVGRPSAPAAPRTAPPAAKRRRPPAPPTSCTICGRAMDPARQALMRRRGYLVHVTCGAADGIGRHFGLW